MSASANPRPPWSLMPLVYDELRRLAAAYVRRERPGGTIQATALVHEAFVRLAAERPRAFENRTHFLAIAALSMRQILVQRARARRALKRGGEDGAAPVRVTLDDAHLPPVPAIEPATGPPGRIDVLALDDALQRLARFDPDGARLVELRYFGGLSIDEVADVLQSSPATVKRRWALIRAWLRRALEDPPPLGTANPRAPASAAGSPR
jgi:RNA polymerase sigma factor (TIGR02999 family)